MKINGKRYREMRSTTFRHDLRVRHFLRDHNIDTVIMDPTGDVNDFARQLMDKLILADGFIGLRLLSLLMVEENMDELDWTEQWAEDFFNQLMSTSDPDEKKQIEMTVVACVVGFFQSGLISLKLSH